MKIILHKYSYFSKFSTSFEQTARSSQSAFIRGHAAILVTVMSISIRTLEFFVSIKTISFDIKLI